jgi:signal transduction histidine kinase
VAHDREIEMTFQSDKKTSMVAGDPARLEQVLNNLVTNAFKFTPKDGKITVEVVRNHETVTVSVSDTGPGIAEENRSLIFEKFRQIRTMDEGGGSTKGIGLGLAICKEIVEHYHGKIWVESEVGQGSRFLFSLPLEKSATKDKRKIA